MKSCSRCGKEYEPTGKSTRNASWCRECSAAYMREWMAKNPEKRKANLRRWWNNHIEENRARARQRYKSLPLEKKKEYSRNYRDARLRREFGISSADYDSMLERQHGVCAICGNGPGKRLLAVDHDHRTGAVRELLCHYCNLQLERFETIQGWAEKATRYLAKHGSAKMGG